MQISPGIYIDKYYEEQVYLEGGRVVSKTHNVLIHHHLIFLCSLDDNGKAIQIIFY